MTVALVVRIGDLLTEFFADTLVLFGSFQPTGTVSAGPLQTVLDHLNHFLIFVETYSHSVHILS